LYSISVTSPIEVLPPLALPAIGRLAVFTAPIRLIPLYRHDLAHTTFPSIVGMILAVVPLFGVLTTLAHIVIPVPLCLSARITVCVPTQDFASRRCTLAILLTLPGKTTIRRGGITLHGDVIWGGNEPLIPTLISDTSVTAAHQHIISEVILRLGADDNTRITTQNVVE
jgi:hypothetical protein